MYPSRFAAALSTTVLCAGALTPALAHAAPGSARVTADTMGLSIFVDGADTGLITPATVGNLAPGRHEIRVRGDCRVGALIVDVKDGATVPVNLATALGRGLLTVDVMPAGSTIEVDGMAITGPSPVSCGSHSVRVTHPGFLAAMSSVEVDVDERRVLEVQLEEVGTATLVLSVTPDTAAVSLDGRVLGTGSISDDAVPAGPHILEVEADGFKPLSQQLLLEAGETKAFTFELEALATARVSAPPQPTTSTSTAARGMSPLKATGIGAAVVGVGLGIYGVTRIGKAASAYDTYVKRAENGPGPESEVAAIRDDQVVPLRNVGLLTTSLGTALLAGGVTMVVAF
jgi:hypothetical protein